jgi:hypothetical protein
VSTQLLLGGKRLVATLQQRSKYCNNGGYEIRAEIKSYPFNGIIFAYDTYSLPLSICTRYQYCTKFVTKTDKTSHNNNYYKLNYTCTKEIFIVS